MMSAIAACVCSPRQFGFRLDLSAYCSGSPGFGAGVQGHSCSIVPTDPNLSAEVELVETTNSSTTTHPGSIRRRMQDGIFQSFANSEELSTTEGAIVLSIEIIELDTDLKILHIDDTYMNVEYPSGSTFMYTSFSEQNPNIIIGGINMVLNGFNGFSEPVMNVFTITYTNECGIPTFQDGDAIGWVVFVRSYF